MTRGSTDPDGSIGAADLSGGAGRARNPSGDAEHGPHAPRRSRSPVEVGGVVEGVLLALAAAAGAIGTAAVVLLLAVLVQLSDGTSAALAAISLVACHGVLLVVFARSVMRRRSRTPRIETVAAMAVASAPWTGLVQVALVGALMSPIGFAAAPAAAPVARVAPATPSER